MKSWLVRLFGGAILLLVVVAIVAWAAVRASLPQLDGEIRVAGLDTPATIARDAHGIPTITAGNRRDLAFATGFAHAQDRFFQMDLIRRQAAGELSELFGAQAIGVDTHYRFHRFRARAKAVVDGLPDSDRAALESYAEGVNAGLASLGARPFEYLLLSVDPAPWRAEDAVLVVYAMFMQLNDSRARRDVRRGYAHQVLEPGVFAWLYPEGTEWDAPLIGEARNALQWPLAHEYSVNDSKGLAPPANEKGRPPLDGSNNWAVGGALTPDGRALVSNDMHLGLSAPNIYYQAQLVVEGDDARTVTGVTLPGTPFVVAGSNGHIAWGYTNSYGDWSDAVLLEPGATDGTYRTAAGDAAIETYSEVIRVKDGPADVYEIRETEWGPIDDKANYPHGEIAVSWIAHKPRAVNLRIIDLETATSVEEALDVANTMGIPPQNFVVGDAGGNIGWTIAGQIPVKAAFDTQVPSVWSEQRGWTGWRTPAEYPRIVNPDGARIWTANTRVVDGDMLDVIGDGGYDLGARGSQIRDALFEKSVFTPADMLAIQTDDRAVFLTRWRALLLEVLDSQAVDGDRALAEYRRLVEEWVPRAARDSVGYRLVRAFRLEVRSRVFFGLTAPIRETYGDDVDLLISNQFEAPLWALVNARPAHLLSAEFDSWEALLVDAVRENLDYFGENYEGPLSDRSWGERNTARIRHPMSRALPMLSGWLDMPEDALNGDVDLPLAQGPDFGASERFSVSPGNEAEGLMQMPTGQSGHPLSPFYRQGHDDWVNGRPSPFLPDETRYLLTLTP